MEYSGMKFVLEKIKELRELDNADLLKLGREKFDKVLRVKHKDEDVNVRRLGLSEIVNYALDELTTKGAIQDDLREKILMSVATAFQIIEERENEAIIREREKFEDTIKNGGLIIHLVPAEDGLHANSHTHGLAENSNHPDIQIVLNLEPYRSQTLLSKMIEQVQKGIKYEPDQRYSGILTNYDILFKTFIEDGRPILRAILPDENGLFPDDEGCDPRYSAQMDWEWQWGSGADTL